MHLRTKATPIASAAACVLVILCLCATANAASLDDWRNEVVQTRQLADNDPRQAYREALRLDVALPAKSTPADRARILNVLARIEIYLALTDAAARHVELALDLASKSNDKVGQVEADLNIALNSVNQGRMDALVATTTHSMTLLDDIDRPELVTEAMLRTATMYGRAGAFDASMTLPMQAMDIARHSNNPIALVYAHEGMAIALEQIARWNEAAEHYTQMRDHARAAHSRILEAAATQGIGDVLTKPGRLQEGESLIREALATFRELDTPFYTAQALLSLAANLKAQKRPGEALVLLDEVLQIYEKNTNKIGLWFTYSDRSNDYLALGRIDDAARDAQRAYDLAAALGAAHYEGRSARQVANIAAVRGEYQAAYKFSTEAAQMKDLADAERASARMLDLAQRYRTEAKQREIDQLTHDAEQHAVRVRWLWTLLGSGAVVFAITAFFLLRQRRSNALLEAANQKLHEAQQNIQAINASLEQRVAERTVQLEAANKAKSTFLANMSHELRTPLNAILGFASLMRRGRDVSESQAESLDIINRSGEHLLALINDVLDMAKVEAGRVKLEIAPFDLGIMVREVVDMMRLRAEEKGLRLLLDQASEFPRYIRGDEARLRQILVNLVGNAVKFTHEGDVIIRLGVKQNHRQHLLIEVEDSGPGISAENQQRIFKPFEQLAETAEQMGTGLGLTITRQFVELMGGSISVESTPGKGSLFRVDLPVDLVAASDVPAVAGVRSGEIAGLVPGHPPYRILVAEDQLENALLLARLMEAIGLETKVVENGEQCVRLFQEWHPDLIWMDRQMPVMDGIEAARRIRDLPGGHDVKIIAVTASAFKEQQAEVLAAGMDEFVRKPYRFGEIYACLAQQLGLEYVYRSESLAALDASVTTVRILIVDDDPDGRFLTKHALKESGFMLREAASGAEALQIFEEWQPHLILMDIRMPGMDGIEATRRIRALPGGDKPLVVALTAGALDEQRAEFIAAGCDDVAIKPVDLNKLQKLLAQHLGNSSPLDAPASAGAVEAVVVPPKAELQILHELALQGSMSEICRYAERVAAIDPRYRPFAGRLLRLAKGFQSQALLALAEEYLRDAAD